jgi:tetratricopeptide (TPR) repeat protein
MEHHRHLDALLGRDDALAALERWLTRRDDALTITGPPGIGKTSLAAHFTARLTALGEEVVWCDLTGARSRADLLDVWVAALELGMTADPAARILEVLSERDALTLVCDGAVGCADALHAALAGWPAAARARLLVTSRRPPGLGHALTLGGLEAAAARDLFTRRARRALPGWSPEGLEDEVDRLNARLEGTPLAIEVAASRIALLSVEELIEGLSAGARARWRRPIDAALERSWDALDATCREVLMRASVFEGGFSLEAAERVATPSDGSWVGDALTALATHSMLRIERADRSRRFRLHSTARGFARARAEADPNLLGDAAALHADWFAAEFARLAPGALGHRGLELERAARRDAANARAAIDALVDAGDAERALALELDLLALTHDRALPDALARLDARAALAAAPSPPLASRLWTARATLLSMLGRLDEARSAGARAHALASDPARRVEAAGAWARALRDSGESEAAQRTLEGALDLALTHGLIAHEAPLRGELALLYMRRARLGEDASLMERAREVLARVLSLEHEAHPRAFAACLDARGLLLHETGQTRQGQVVLEDLVAQTLELGFHAEAMLALSHASALAYFSGDFTRARDLATRCERAAARRGHHERRAREECNQGIFALAQGDLEAAEVALLRAEERCQRQGQPVTRLVAASQLVMLYVEAQDPAQARQWRDAALTQAAALGATGHEGLARLWGALLDADVASLDASLTAIAHAADLLSTSWEYQRPSHAPRWSTMRVIFEHHARVCHAVRLLEGDDVAAARPLIDRARAYLDAAPPPDTHTLVATRQLRGALTRAVARFAIPETDDDDAAALRAAPDGSWFEIDASARVSLTQRETLRRLFAALLERWRPAPDAPEPLDVDAMIEVGWPGERLEPQSAANRVYASIRLLRKLGLRDVLVTLDGGYALDPGVHVLLDSHEHAEDP